MIRIDGKFEGKNHCTRETSKRSRKEPHPRRETALTVHQAAEILGCRPGLIYKLVRDGKLRGYTVGRLLRFRRDDIDAYMSREQGGQEQQNQAQPPKRKRYAAKPAMRNEPKSNELTREELESLCL
jgi:excisionase family DNA binding protein